MKDQRTPEEKFDDLLADDYTLDEIADALGWTWGRARAHYIGVCAQLGEKPDEV